MAYKSSLFGTLAKHTAHAAGHPITFSMAVLIILAWGITGPLFGFSDTWQLVINTTTTIITFLMVFLLQNSQNRDTAAMQLKLDELVRAIKAAQNTVLNLEDLDDDELEALLKKYRQLAINAREKLGHEKVEAAGHNQKESNRG